MGSRPLPRLLKGLGALTALAALEAGVPLALLAWGTNPHHVPTWQQTTNALTSPDNGGLFLGAITAVGWLAWGLFTLQVLLELVAVLRHRAAPRLPVLGAGQHLAATLVAAAVLLLPTTGTAIAQTAPAPAATLHLPHHATPDPHHVAADVVADAASGWKGRVHQVTSGDETMWGLAEHYLGDGTRWKDIAALNDGIMQTDGQTLTASTLHLVPGWTLRLPADAKHPAPASSAHHATKSAEEDHRTARHGTQESGAEHESITHETVHIVKPGETLSGIAADDLGNADDYPAIFKASQRIEQPGGAHLTDSNHILPGWHLTIPQPASAPALESPERTPTPPPAPTGDGSHTGTSPAATPTAAPTAPTATPAPTGSQSAAALSGPVAAAVGAPTAPGPSTTAKAPPTTAASSTPTGAASPATPSPAAEASATETGSELRIGAAIAALLAAGLVGGYGIKRALQQRSRRPGETIAIAPEASSLEQILANQADAPTAERLDLALRTLAGRIPEDEPLPVLEAARITPTGIHLRADGPPIAPFTAGEDGWWNLDPTADLLDPATAADVAAPYPMLTTIGTEPDGTLLLLNLAAARTLLLDGSAQEIREVARGLALDTATSPWGQELQVLSAGLVEAGLPAMMATGRIRCLDRIRHAVTDLADLLLTAYQDHDASMPWMLVAADNIDPETAWELANLISRSPTAPVALALPAHGLQSLFPEALVLDCATTDPQLVPPGAAAVNLQRVTETEYQILKRDLGTTEEPAKEATGAWTRVADDSQDLDDPKPGLAGAAASAHTSKSAAEEPAGSAPVTPFLAFTKSAGETARPAVPVPVPPTQVAAPAAKTDGVATQSAAVAGPADLHAPEIRVLGPVDVTGLGSSGRGRRLAEVAAYLYLRPGRMRDDLAYAMNPITPWNERTVKQRLHDVRILLGNTSDGNPRLPRKSRDGVLPALIGVRCDWTRFCKLAESGLLAGPAGVDGLETALALVRGRPFAGSTAAWSMPDQQEMVSRIVDTAHTVARYQTASGHYSAARAAIAKGVEVEPTAERLYRDWIALEAACGNRAEVQRVISRLQKELRALDVEMEDATEKLIQQFHDRDLKGSA